MSAANDLNAIVRPFWPDTLAAATQKEKADAAELEGERGKLIVTVPGINQPPLIMPLTMATYRRRGVAGKPTWEEFPGTA